MLHPLRFTALCLLAACVAADEWADTCGPVDASALAAEARVIELTAPRVARINPGSAAQGMGLRVGDRLVGCDGLRIYGQGEWDLVRYNRPGPPGVMAVAVWRQGALLTLTTRSAEAVRRLGADFGDQPGLENALTTLAAPACGWQSFPRRDGAALLRWAATAPPTADRGWITALAQLYAALAAQDWAAAARMEVQPPEPGLAALAAFYQRLARRHADGEQEPDPQRLGQTPSWYTIHYPYPTLVLPALGAFTHPDPAFMTGLAALRDDPADVRRDGAAAAEALERQADESWYQFCVRKSLLDERNHGGWPYRYTDVWEDARRPGLIAGLRAVAEGGGEQAAWSRFCLLCPLQIAARGLGGAERTRPMLDALRAVRAASPLLGYLGAVQVLRAMGMWEVPEVMQRLDDALVDDPFRLTAKPSRLLDHLRAREASIQLQVIDPADMAWPRRLWLVHGALHRATTVAALRARLAAAAAVDRDPAAGPALDPAQRAELVRTATGTFRYAYSTPDALALGALGAPGRGQGLVLDAFAELFYCQTPFSNPDMATGIAALAAVDPPATQAESVAGMRAAIAAIAWDGPAVAAAVDGAAAAWGGSAATLVLADACAAHGQAAAASAQRARVTDLQQRIEAYCAGHQATTRARADLAARALPALLLSPATAPLALAIGERADGEIGLEEQCDALQLALALAQLAAGRPDAAEQALERSFTTGRTAAAAQFWLDGAPVAEAAACRTWILRRVLAAGPLAAPRRKQLLAVLRPALIDDAFAGLLGLERGKLPADPHAAAASGNDF